MALHRTLALLALLLSRCSCFSLATSQLRKLELWLDLPSTQTDASLVRKFLRTELGASDALPLCTQTVRPHSVEVAPAAEPGEEFTEDRERGVLRYRAEVIGRSVSVTRDNHLRIAEAIEPGDRWILLRSRSTSWHLIEEQLDVLPALLSSLGVRLAVSATTPTQLFEAASAMQRGGGRTGGDFLLGDAADGIAQQAPDASEADVAVLLAPDLSLWRAGRMLLDAS